MTLLTQKSSAKRRGRPRSLTLDTIVTTACELPPGRLDMATLAEKLKVGVATLYGYVEGREHLMRLVSERKGELQPIIDHGQSWQDILREHARSTYQTATEWPELISQIMQGGVFGDVEAQYLEHFIELLCARGFSPGSALELYYSVNQLVLGAAVTAAYLRATNDTGGHTALLRRFILGVSTQQLPRLRLAIEQNPLPASLANFETALEQLLGSCRPDADDTTNTPSTSPVCTSDGVHRHE